MPDSQTPSSQSDPATTCGSDIADLHAARLAHLNPEARDALAAELDLGETVLWCGRPDPLAAAKHTAVLGGLFGLWMVAMLVMTVAGFRTIRAELQGYAPAIESLPQGALPEAELNAAFFASVGALSLGALVCWCNPILVYGLARRTLYAVTTTRVLRMVRFGRWTRTRAFELGLPLVVSRSESPRGVSSLTLCRRSTMCSSYFRFEHIQNSREAERVIRQSVARKSPGVAASRDDTKNPTTAAVTFDTTANESLDRIPNSTRQFLQSQLQPGESVLWADQPDMTHSLTQLRWGFRIMWLLCLACAALSAAMLLSAIGESRGYKPWFDWHRLPSPPGRNEIVDSLVLFVLFVACLPLVAWMPKSQARLVRQQTYALTNKRILVLKVLRRGFLVRSLLLARPLDTVCSGLRNGVGNLALVRNKWGNPAAFKLISVPNARQVERLIRQTFDPAPSQPPPPNSAQLTSAAQF